MIISPYRFTAAEQITISTLNNDWENTSDEIKNIKESIKNHLKKLIGYECYYCKIKVEEGISSVQLDHIVYKANYENFTFRPENLIFCCARCNTNKGKKEVLNLSLRNTSYSFDDYPLNSSDYTIVHPYLDNYYEHIHYPDGFFAESLNNSSKGIKTINLYKLYRSALIESRIRKEMEFLTNEFVENVNSGKIDVKELDMKKFAQTYARLDKLKKDISAGYFTKQLDYIVKNNLNTNFNQEIHKQTLNLFELKEKIDTLITLLEYLKKIKATNNMILNYFQIKNYSNILTGLLNRQSRELLIKDIEYNILKIPANTKIKILCLIKKINFSDKDSSNLIKIIKKSKEIFFIFDLIYKTRLYKKNFFILTDIEVKSIKSNIKDLSSLESDASKVFLENLKTLLYLSNYLNLIENNNYCLIDNLKTIKKISKFLVELRDSVS